MKKQHYLHILAAAIIIIAVGYMMNIHFIKMFSRKTLQMMQSAYVCIPAAVCAFIFLNNKHYWLLNSGAALIASLIIQYGVIGAGAGAVTILSRALAFLVIVYLLNLVKVILNK